MINMPPSPTGSRNRIPGLDLLRTLAITMVFLYHYARLFPSPAWIGSLSSFGWTGVDLFFVLSGYLIASQLFQEVKTKQNISFKRFYTKRIFRILPAYLLVTAIYFVFPIVRERGTLAPLYKYLTFTQNIGLNLLHHGAFSHAWSLCIEEQFYLLLPVILYLLNTFRLLKKSAFLLIFLFALGVLVRALAWQHAFSFTEEPIIKWYEFIYYPTYSRLDGLLAGVSLAAIVQFKPNWVLKIRPYPTYILLTGIMILTAAFFICQDQTTFIASVWGFPLIAIGYGLLVYYALLPSGITFNIFSKPAAFSYSIYLVHKIVIHLTQQLLSGSGIAKDGNTMFFICLVLTIIVAYLMNVFVERPFMRLIPSPISHRMKTPIHAAADLRE